MIEIPSIKNVSLRKKRAADYLGEIRNVVRSDSIVARLEDLAKGNLPTRGEAPKDDGPAAAPA